MYDTIIHDINDTDLALPHLALVAGLLGCQVVPLPPLKVFSWC